jgi:hypothetical protein
MNGYPEESSAQAAESGWMGLSGAIGGCLTVIGALSFFLCLGAFALGSLVRFDELGNQVPVVPYAIPAFYALACITVLSAILGGTALGIRAFGQKGVSTSEALRATFVSALLPLRYVIGALQSIAGLSIFLVLFLSGISVWWPIGALVVLSIIQGILLLTIRLLGGPGTVGAIIESEH